MTDSQQPEWGAQPGSPTSGEQPQPSGGHPGVPHHHDPAHRENDPVTDMVEEGGPLAEPAVESAGEPEPEPADALAEARARVAALTDDLQRLQAEYLNYKRRVDRDRELTRENATFVALTPITEVLDTIDRARDHGPLDDGLKAVADQLEAAVSRQGLVRYGQVGEAFDPNLHEALSHLGTEADIEVTTIKVVARAGYKIGDRVLRAAQVLVVDPER